MLILAPNQILDLMKQILTRLLVGRMSMRKRSLIAVAGIALALTVVFGSLTYVEAVPTDTLKLWKIDAPEDYCTDYEEGPCGELMSCKDLCEDDDECCPTGTPYTPFICMYGC